MLRSFHRSNAGRLSLLLCAALVLGGCNAFRFATGRIKATPDEFAVRTFAPLAMPPDGNLRLPQTGAPSRNELAAAARARAALFAQSEPAVAIAADAYSAGEIFLLSKARAAYVLPENARDTAPPAAMASTNQTLSLRRSFDR